MFRTANPQSNFATPTLYLPQQNQTTRSQLSVALFSLSLSIWSECRAGETAWRGIKEVPCSLIQACRREAQNMLNVDLATIESSNNIVGLIWIYSSDAGQIILTRKTYSL